MAAVHPNLAAKRIDEAVFVGITYVGPITPGGENYTLVGDAKVGYYIPLIFSTFFLVF